MKTKIIALLTACLALTACGNSNSSAEPVNSESETTVEEIATANAWSIEYFVDDFGRATDEPYVIGSFSGTFSNSAATNEKLTGYIYVERYNDGNDIIEGVSFDLREYGSYQVKNIISKDKYYTVQILEENENVISERAVMRSEGNALCIWKNTSNVVVDAMKNNNKLTFRIDAEDGMDSYLFIVDCSGFSEMYSSAEWKE